MSFGAVESLELIIAFAFFNNFKSRNVSSRLVVEHETLVKDHSKTLGELSDSEKKGAAIAEKRDIMDVDNKKLRAENTKLSIELTDFKKALARFAFPDFLVLSHNIFAFRLTKFRC